jgi:hypothetical protein
MNKELQEIYDNLIFALKPVWNLSKEDQAKVLEPFIGKTINKAKIKQEPTGTLS